MASKQCDPKNKSRNTSKISAIWKSITVQVVLLMVVFIAWAVVHISDHVPALNHIPASPSVKMEVDRAEQDRILAERRALQRENFFREDIVPLIHEASRRNQKSMDQAIENIEGIFHRYRSRVDSFVEDLASYKTRARILWRMPGDWWNNEDRVKELVSEKFEEHLFSKDEVVEDISHVLTGFAEEIRASENQLLMDCKAAVSSSDMPEITLPGIERYATEVQNTIGDFVQDRAKSSVYSGVTTLVASEAGASVAVVLVRNVLKGLGLRAALSASQTVAGTAAGSALGGSSGNIFVACVGLVVGIVIDWWMTDNFKEKLSGDLNTYIRDLQSGILQGSEESQGLRYTLQALVDDYHTAQRTALRKNIVEVKS